MMQNEELVIKIDKVASKIIQKGGDAEALLNGLIDYRDDFYRILKTSSPAQLDKYCKKFPGFYEYIKVVSNLAELMEQGKFPATLTEPKYTSNSTDNKTPTDRKSMKEIQQVMNHALLQIRDLVNLEASDQSELIPPISLFLLSVISTAADLVEVAAPGGGAYLYAEIEAGAKMGGISSISKAMQDRSPHYSISGMNENDLPTAMNYIGQQLIITLTKAMHELPEPLRTPEIQLRGIEALLANLLNQKFDNPHGILDSLCDHVHMALNDLRGNSKVSTLH